MKWYIKVLKQYADFEGRARRTEYWMFALFHVLIFIVLEVLLFALAFALRGSGSGGGIGLTVGLVLLGLYFVATLLPSIAVSARRLHDTDRSGWWLLLSFVPFGSLVLLVFHCLEGTPGPNQYGPDPKAPAGVGYQQPGGYGQVGYEQGGYEQGGYQQGGYQQGGYGQGGYQQGGYQQGGQQQGGYQQGGYQQGGYGQGGYQQGGYQQGGQQQGGYQQPPGR